MSVFTLELNAPQVRALLKQTVLQSMQTDPDMLQSVLDEIKQEQDVRPEFKAALEQIFDEYDDVFKALA